MNTKNYPQITQISQIKDPRTFAIIGAAMEVHRILGRGFLEGVYQQALAIEFEKRGIPFQSKPHLTIYYKDVQLSGAYQPDFICYDDVLVEIKALVSLSGTEEAQVLNYLKASRLRVALLLNFGEASLSYKRFVL